MRVRWAGCVWGGDGGVWGGLGGGWRGLGRGRRGLGLTGGWVEGGGSPSRGRVLRSTRHLAPIPGTYAWHLCLAPDSSMMAAVGGSSRVGWGRGRGVNAMRRLAPTSLCALPAGAALAGCGAPRDRRRSPLTSARVPLSTRLEIRVPSPTRLTSAAEACGGSRSRGGAAPGLSAGAGAAAGAQRLISSGVPGSTRRFSFRITLL